MCDDDLELGAIKALYKEVKFPSKASVSTKHIMKSLLIISLLIGISLAFPAKDGKEEEALRDGKGLTITIQGGNSGRYNNSNNYYRPNRRPGRGGGGRRRGGNGRRRPNRNNNYNNNNYNNK